MLRYPFLITMILLFSFYFGKNSFFSKDVADLTGIWKAQDGAFVELRNDGTCRLTNFDLGKTDFVLNYGEKISSIFYGKWNYKGYFKNTLEGKNPDRLLLEVKNMGNNVNYILIFKVGSLKDIFLNKDPQAIYLCRAINEKYQFKKIGPS